MIDWKKTLGMVAPALASALGGPAAGTAVGVLATQFLGNSSATEQQVAEAIAAAAPADLARLREIDNAFRIEMERIGVDVFRIEMADRGSARDRESKTGDSWTPRLIACAVVVGWLSVQWFLLHYVVPAENRELVLGALRTLDAALMFVLGYYFGGMNRTNNNADSTSRKG